MNPLDSFYYISKKDLMEKLDQEYVWRQILGNVKVGQGVLNPFRNDKNTGSCYLHWMEGTLRLIDFADKTTSGLDCISGYMKCNPNLSWNQVCQNLLNIGKTFPPSSYTALPGLKVKTSSIEYEPLYRNWEDRDIRYWGLRGVNLNQFEGDFRVKPINGFIQTGDSKIESHFNDLGYVYHFNPRVKFYFPDRNKPRFLGNAKGSDLWHLKRGSDTLVIQKSHKDFFVLENLCEHNILVTQNETPTLGKDVLFDLESYYKKVFIWYDPDEAGIKGAERLRDQFLYTPVETITSEGGKDLDEMYLNHGERFCLTFIKNNV